MATLAASIALPRATARPRAIAAWLFAVAALVFAMVVVGGITRLTESGLSITRWDVVSGTLPPIGEAQWAAAFDAYKASSQYQLMNRGMTLAEFHQLILRRRLVIQERRRPLRIADRRQRSRHHIPASDRQP